MLLWLFLFKLWYKLFVQAQLLKQSFYHISLKIDRFIWVGFCNGFEYAIYGYKQNKG